MMDFHLLIIIACVFLASLSSLLLINKFVRGKAYEEKFPTKKSVSEKVYQSATTTVRRPKKVQPKKELKREKKKKEQQHNKDTIEQESSLDGQSGEQQTSEKSTHVVFDSKPEILNEENLTRRASNSDKESLGGSGSGSNQKQKLKKEKKIGKVAGILLNKHETVAIKENLIVEEQSNNFDTKPPKDTVELKKLEKEKKSEDKQQQQQQQQSQQTQQGKKEKNAKKEKHVEQPIELPIVAKEIKQQEEKQRQGSPKSQQNSHNSNSNSSGNNGGSKSKQQHKKQNKETTATKDLIVALDKLSDTDTIGVSLLMNLFRRAELNRSEIQILIDYLLNKQQDMPTSHSEWSDDICQKLKRQLEEKERALTEEQEASVGIQAKLRELRTEINSERAQMTATVKAYVEKLQTKEQEITRLNQEMQTLNEKLTLEHQQFQSKLLREKQAGSQDLLAQLQMMQSELAQKEKCINDLVKASHQAVDESQQKTEIIQSQAQQILTLEQQRDELEEVSNNRIFELERVKTLETENAESKVEIRNLQNALESAKADLAQADKDIDLIKLELTRRHETELNEKQQEIQSLQLKIGELSQDLVGISSQREEETKEQLGLQATLDEIRTQLHEKEAQLEEFNKMNLELRQQVGNFERLAEENLKQAQKQQQLADHLQSELNGKDKRLQEAEETADVLGKREKELAQLLHEQKEKNNQQEQLLAASTVKSSTASASVVTSDQSSHIRELFDRLYPDAVKASAGTALSLSFDQWVEQVLATHVKQSISKLNASNAVNTTTATTNTNAVSSSNKSTQSNSNTNSNNSNSNSNSNSSNSGDSGNGSSNHNSTHNSHNNNNNNLLNSESTTTTNINNNNNNNNDSDSKLKSSTSNNNNINNNNNSSSGDNDDIQKLQTENAQLRAQVGELTKIVTKTSNTLSELEIRAREQDDYWRSVVGSKDEIISSLQHSNGKQQDI